MKRLSVPPPPSINERVGKASQSLADMSGTRLLFKIFSLVFLAHVVMSTYLHFTREDHLDDQAYDEFGVHLSAHDLERVRRDRETEAMPTLLMVCGLEKSGATYIRQLLLDNLEIAPLDTHDSDHHNELHIFSILVATSGAVTDRTREAVWDLVDPLEPLLFSPFPLFRSGLNRRLEGVLK